LPRSRLALLAVASLFAGCGSSENGAADAQRKAESASTLAQAQSILRPPEIYLLASAGRQHATPAKSCVLTVGQGRGEGAGKCTVPKGRVRAGSYTVARPGEQVRILLADAKIIRRPGCTDPRECGGRATLRPAGCRREVASFRLRRPLTGWRVPDRTGTYELEISVDFETPDALTGDATAIAGLVVHPRRELEIVPAARADASCPRQ
jgi:hypothetical protein